MIQRNIIATHKACDACDVWCPDLLAGATSQGFRPIPILHICEIVKSYMTYT